jgi:serine protease Do
MTAAGAGPATLPASRGLEKLDFREVIASAKDKVFPAVVFIKAMRESLEGGEKAAQEVAGSGVLISANGELLTNWHVVDKATDVRCLLSDGRSFDARIVGSDKDTDLALVRLKMPGDGKALPFAVLGESARLTEGDFVMAMGAPWGLSRSVSIGIVSCSRRFLPGSSEYSLWLQTDASISPGNSGGPLVDTDGRVIGLNARGMTMGGDMGFAIPSDTIRTLLPQLREHGRVDWSWTGLQLQPLKDFNRNNYFDGTEGVMVAETDADSPARRAGIQSRDRIVRINGESVAGLTEEDLPALRRRLGLLPKEKPAALELVREGKALSVAITPRAKGTTQGEELDCPRWDLTVKTINQFDNPDLFFHREKGVFVFGIRAPGNAMASGLQRNDIILKVDGKEVVSLDDVKAAHKAALANIAEKHRILLTVLRNGRQLQTVVDFSRDYSRE